MALTKIKGSVFDIGNNGSFVSALSFSNVYPDGSADSLIGLQEAIDYCYANNKALFIPAGLYEISATLNSSGAIVIFGEYASPYVNWVDTTVYSSYEKRIPVYNGTVIQNTASVRTALLNGFKDSTISNIAFRTGKARSTVITEDVLFAADTSGSHIHFSHCRFENFTHLLRNDSSAAGGWVFDSNLVMGGARAFYGSTVDNIITKNKFTSQSDIVIQLLSGAGINTISDNRFEFGSKHAIKTDLGSRNNLITGNMFDAYLLSALFLNGGDENIVSNNVFWRNGRYIVDDPTNTTEGQQGHIYIRLTGNGGIISNNIFKKGRKDGVSTGDEFPYYVVEYNNSENSNIQWSSNDSRFGGFKGFAVNYSGATTWGNTLVIDTVNVMSDSTAGTASDTIINQLNHINRISNGACKVIVNENRNIVGYDYFDNINIVAGNNGGVSFVNDSGTLGVNSFDNITYNSLVYSVVNSLQFTSAQPNSYRTQGRWKLGRRIYNSTPLAGGTEGWVVTTEGSPDTWKTFGVIQA